MQIYEELVARGLIAQVTNEEEIKKMVNEGKATFYIGFDPTADSLHVGHFMGSVPDEETSDGRKQAYRPDWRRNRIHRRSVRKNRHEIHDDSGDDPAQLRLL